MSKKDEVEKMELRPEDKAVIKKQVIKLIISSVVLLILIGAYFGLKNYNKKVEEKNALANVTPTIFNFTSDEFKTLSYSYNGETYSYTKDGDEWIYDGDTSMDIQESSISTMITKLTGVEYDTMVENATDLEQYGITSDSDVITWTTADGSYQIIIGSLNDMTGLYYISTGHNTLYTVESSFVKAFTKTPDDIKVLEEVVEDAANAEES